MPEISQIRLPSGTIYDIKDTVARQTAGGGLQFRGVTTTELTDEATTTTYVVAGETITASNGDLVIYNKKEFLYSTADNKWHELGDNSAFKALAYKDSASGSYTPAGTVSQPTFSGSSSNVTITATDNTSGNYQPKGTVSQPTFSGSSMTSTGKFTPSGTVSFLGTASKNATFDTSTVAPGNGNVSVLLDASLSFGAKDTSLHPVSQAESGTATYTPAGTVAAPTFTGTESTISSSATYKPKGTITLNKATKYVQATENTSGGYQPKGTVSAPTISVETAGTTTSIRNPTSVTVAKTLVTAAPGATAPSNAVSMCSVSGEVLSIYQLGYTTGASITTSNVTVKTGDASYTASQPTFTGTKVNLTAEMADTATFAGTEETISSSATYTPAGSNSAPTFTGTGARLVTDNLNIPSNPSLNKTARYIRGSVTVDVQPKFTGTEGDVSVTGTPAGTVSQPTFTGTKTQLAGTTTAAGTVSQPTFSGTPATITVS